MQKHGCYTYLPSHGAPLSPALFTSSLRRLWPWSSALAPQQMRRGRKVIVMICPTLLGEMQLSLYLREDGVFLVATKKERAIGGLLEKKKWVISPNMKVLWGWWVGLRDCEMLLEWVKLCSESRSSLWSLVLFLYLSSFIRLSLFEYTRSIPRALSWKLRVGNLIPGYPRRWN